MKSLVLFSAIVLVIPAAKLLMPKQKREIYNGVADDVVCPTDFVSFGQECYYFSIQQNNFTNALQHCRSRNSLLAFPVNGEQNIFMKDSVRQIDAKNGAVGWWIGGSDYGLEGNWVEITEQGGCSFPYSDWCPGEPNNYGVENCLAFRQQCNYKWEDRSCDYPGYRYICQLNAAQ